MRWDAEKYDSAKSPQTVGKEDFGKGEIKDAVLKALEDKVTLPIVLD